MYCLGVNAPVPSYKSYKAEKFNKWKEKARNMRTGVKETSLKEEDKKALIKLMIDILNSK